MQFDNIMVPYVEVKPLMVEDEKNDDNLFMPKAK